MLPNHGNVIVCLMSSALVDAPLFRLTVEPTAEKKRLRIRLAEHDRSMEDEVREILRTALAARNEPPMNLADSIRKRFGPLGGVDLPPVPRADRREPPTFEE